MAQAPAYPFRPKSNRWLAAGQLWSVPLGDGRYACGRVMAPAADFSERSSFVAGLMDWVGDAPPHAAEIAGCGVVEQGVVDVGAIHGTGGLILGCRALELDGLSAEHELDSWSSEQLALLAERHFA